MATTNYPDTLAATKGKMIAVEPQVSDIASLKPVDSNKIIEVIVYRKWVSKYVHTRQPIRFCCILIDRQGTPIQAIMDAKDTEYFDQLLQLHSAYRITGFSSEQTVPWERTLDNPTSLTFGKFISLQEIPNADFPKHYINFAAYNELPTKVNVKNKVLTDFTFDSGNIIQLALWHEMALTFNIREYKNMEKPVVIAVSSCWVRHFNGLQLSGTSATHYCLNPNIPETHHIKQQYQQPGNNIPVLNIDNQRHQDLEQEKYRNRFPLATLLEVNPQNYQALIRYLLNSIFQKTIPP
ncbi:DNA helicase [Tanacetum coccineum]